MEVFFGLAAIAAMTAFVRDRRRVRELEDKIRDLRSILAGNFPYRLPEPRDADLLRKLEMIVRANAPLSDAGLTSLGNLVMEVPGSEPIAMLHALVNAEHKTVVYITWYPASPHYASMLLESYATDAEYITHVNNPVRTSAPFSHQQSLPSSLPMRELLARHAAFAKAADIRIANLEELVRELRRNHALFMRWRETKAPDELLEIDLRTLFGEAYEIHGARWKRRLALRLPQATLRR